MVLTSHAIAGAAAASAVPAHPIAGFFLGFASHFILDAIPHWDYRLSSLSEDLKNPLNNDFIIGKNFAGDLLRTGLDFAVGFVFVFLFFGFLHSGSYVFSVYAGAFGGVAPDILQFLYSKIRKEPLTSLQKFHIWIHSKIKIKKTIPGVSLQITFILVIIILQKLIIKT